MDKKGDTSDLPERKSKFNLKNYKDRLIMVDMIVEQTLERLSFVFCTS